MDLEKIGELRWPVWRTQELGIDLRCESSVEKIVKDGWECGILLK